jgi:hypothetical protein
MEEYAIRIIVYSIRIRAPLTTPTTSGILASTWPGAYYEVSKTVKSKEEIISTLNKHFKGANDSILENYGDVETLCESEHGTISCGWKAANVSRPPHSISRIAGLPGGTENSKQDILFNNEKCYVVAPGIVKKIMEHCKAVAEYDREGNLYIGEMTLSSFHRQGLSQ